MAAKKDLNGAMPMTPETDTTPSAKITYANEVVAIIAGLAANEVEGIAGMCSVSGNILNKNRNVTKGVYCPDLVLVSGKVCLQVH